MTIQEAVDDYAIDLGAKNRSLSTSETYKYALKRFLVFLQREYKVRPDEPLDRITQAHAQRFGHYLYGLKLSPATRGTYLVVLRNWFRYLGRHPELPGGSPVNPDLIDLPRVPRRVPEPDERLQVMLSIPQPAGDPWHSLIGMRDKAILETLFASQMRVSEVVSLNRNSIDWGQGLAVITGKGRKARSVFFSRRALDAIEAYLEARNDSYLPLFIHHDRAHQRPPQSRPSSPVPLGESKGEGRRRSGGGPDGQHMRLTRQSVEAVVRKYARLAGVDATPHTFRHYGATELLRNGADIRTVQELLGHASVQTTQIYTHVSPRRLQQEWQRFHPAAGGREERDVD